MEHTFDVPQASLLLFPMRFDWRNKSAQAEDLLFTLLREGTTGNGHARKDI